MHTSTLWRAFVVSCAVAGAAACNNANTTNTSADRTPASSTTADTARTDANRDKPVNQPIALDGCLQKGTGGTYLLTRINEPAHKNVGSTGSGSAVEQEQLWLARNEYRIDPAHDVKVDDLVGKQVRVSGTLVDRADLPSAQQQKERDARDASNNSRDVNRPAATTGSDKGADVSQSDLAKIDATAVSMVAESCGSKTAGTSGKVAPHKAAPSAKKSSK
jgi:hypothetical protein